MLTITHGIKAEGHHGREEGSRLYLGYYVWRLVSVQSHEGLWLVLLLSGL